MKDKFNLKTFAQFALLLVLFILAAFLASGIDLDWAKVWNWVFFGIIVVRAALMITTYNTVFGMDVNNRRRNQKGQYYLTALKYRKKVDIIYRDNLHDKLTEAVKAENRDRIKAAQDNAIRQVHGRLEWSEVDSLLETMTAEEVAERYKLTGKKYKQFLKTVKNILNGNLDCELIEDDDIRIDKDGIKDKEISVKDKTIGFLATGNARQMATFLAANILMSVIMYVGGQSNIWIEICKNAVLFLSASTAGMGFAQNYIKRRTAMLSARNNFMQRRLGINEAAEAPAAENKDTVYK